MIRLKGYAYGFEGKHTYGTDEVSLSVFDLSTRQGGADFEAVLKLLRDSASMSGDEAVTVQSLLEKVRQGGDEAVVEAMRRWTDPQFTRQRIRVSSSETAAALDTLDPDLRRAIETAIQHVRSYQQHIMPTDPQPLELDGAHLGMRFTAVDSAGLLVPGGTAVLFSSLIMLAVPAQVAGVDSKRLAVTCPPPTRRPNEPPVGDLSPILLGTCALLGIERLYRIGGAQAVAALAFGTESIEPVDLIAGPGNLYVQLAKKLLGNRVGTDGFYGPSEILTIADESANAAAVASDLIAQAEHDPGKCFLVCWSRTVIDAVNDQIDRQLPNCRRRSAIQSALERDSCALLGADRQQAIQVANRIAAEHVNLAVADPEDLLDQIRHGGEFFLGDQSPVAAGDYIAGPSHCLPTATTARFSSGVSAYSFLKRSGTIHYRQGLRPRAIDAIARMAEAEGLDGHAASVLRRRSGGEAEERKSDQ